MTEKKVSFWRIFWPSVVAIIITSTLGWIFFFVIIGGIFNIEPKPYTIDSKSILHLTLDGQIGEKSAADLNLSSLNMDKTIGLSEILYGIERAKEDDKVKGLFIELKNLSCGYATAREIRNAIKDFNQSGKFSVAYNKGEVISQKKYYISSAAKEVYGFPTSAMEFIGLGSEMMFFKGTLDKLDVEMQVIRGKNNDFKSAVEPFFRTNMSDSSRLQVTKYMHSIWNTILTDISKDRKVSTSTLIHIAETVKIRRAEDAVGLKLLDGVHYEDEIQALLAEKLGTQDDDELPLFAIEKYARKKFKTSQVLIENDDPTIAVILAEGEVSTDGDGLSSKEICKLFQDVRKNKSIKTVVFRINSPGGSALASEEIWREVELTTKKRKVIVSMGDVAASGGYYIATPAYKIFAEPSTITGSIGVFGVIPYTGKMLENKLGLSFDRTSTNKHAVMTTNRKLTPEELATIQEEVDQIYTTFLTRVANGRKMKIADVNKIARGRVWTGTDAKKIGLVDELGGLKEAIAFAAKEANVDTKKVLYYPLQKENKLAEVLEILEEQEEESNANVNIKNSNALPEELTKYYQQLKRLEQMRGIQMRMPFDVELF